MFKLLALTIALSVFTPKAEAATAVGVADTAAFMDAPSVSALFSNNEDWIQTMLNVQGVKGSFRFSLGGAYKFTVAGNGRAGFHIGPGLSIGTVGTPAGSDFGFALVGMFGGHYTLFERMIVSFDAGPILRVVDGDVDFGVAPMGGLLGLSAHYLF
ncbi:MAG: hypothetical protein EOP11_15355 [Proteobacteria bacterium]|nr:MAG: hypothetical protein EOP11_15355 [Pseudomonadota bacterium]